MKNNTNLRARACGATYAIFATIGCVPMLLGLFAAARTGNWKDFPVFIVLPIVLLAWVHAFKLEVVDGILMYRTLLGGSRSIALSAIASAEIKFGIDSPFGTFYRLIIYPSTSTDNPIVVNMKVFSREDVNRLLNILGPKFKGQRRLSIFKERHAK